MYVHFIDQQQGPNTKSAQNKKYTVSTGNLRDGSKKQKRKKQNVLAGTEPNTPKNEKAVQKKKTNDKK